MNCPFLSIDITNPSEKDQHRQLMNHVQRMLDQNKRIEKAKTPQAKTVLQRQIEATDRQIDELVYTLYGLTKEEIELVEKSTGV